jgi:hypothetical protein
MLEPLVHTAVNFYVEVLQRLFRHLLCCSEIKVFQAPAACLIMEVCDLLEFLNHGLPLIFACKASSVDMWLPYQCNVHLYSNFVPLTTLGINELTLVNNGELIKEFVPLGDGKGHHLCNLGLFLLEIWPVGTALHQRIPCLIAYLGWRHFLRRVNYHPEVLYCAH